MTLQKFEFELYPSHQSEQWKRVDIAGQIIAAMVASGRAFDEDTHIPQALHGAQVLIDLARKEFNGVISADRDRIQAELALTQPSMTPDTKAN